MAYQAVVDMQFNAILQAPDVATCAAAGLSQGQALAEMRDNDKIAEKETASQWISATCRKSCASPTSTGG
jgi:hypothetical protein